MRSDKGEMKKLDITLTDMEVLNILEIPVISLDQSFAIRALNLAAEKFTGMHSDALIGRDYRTIIGFENTPDGRDPAQMVMETAVPHAGDAIARVNGSTIPIKYGISPVLDNSGQVNGVINYIVDQRQKGVVGEIVQLSREIQEGNLIARADPLSFEGDARTILEEVNNILDAVVDPLNLTALYINKISKGEIPDKITEMNNGDFREISSSLNQCIENLNRLIIDASTLYQEQKAGDIEANIDTSGYQGFYKSIVEGYNDSVNLHVRNIVTILTILSSYAEGDFTPILQKMPGKQVLANEKMDLLRGNLLDLLEDINGLTRAAIHGELSTRADATKHQGDFRKIVEGMNSTLDAFVQPINVTAEYVDRISKGEIPAKITDTYNGDFNEIKNNLNQCIDVMSGLLTETDTLIKATQAGKLDTRGAAKNFPGGWGTLVGGVNDLIDAFVQPINVTAEYVDRISKGEIPAKITDTYNGDFNEIKNNLNQCIDVMSGLLTETETLIKATKAGKLDTRGAAKNFPGGWGTLVGGVNDLIDAFVQPINVTAEYVDRISKGEIPAKITDTYNGDFNEIKNNLNQCIDVMSGLLTETDTLITATKAGQLDTRGAAKNFPGDWGTLVGGVNDLIDAFVQPINVTAEYVDRISKGEIPAKITDTYNGDFNEIKNNLNQCIDVMSGLLTETDTLITATKAGQLDTRGDAKNFPGGWGTLVGGVNDLIDAFVQPINITAEYVDRISKGEIPAKITDTYNGDFNEIKNNLNQCIDALTGLITDMNHMSSEHDRGDIDVMMDPARFQGAYHEMAEGINKMVSGHIAVKKKAMACVKEFGIGNFDAPLEQFPLKKAFINDTIEQVRKNLKALIVDTNKLTESAVAGKLRTRADATKHQGDFRKIVEGVNSTLDAVITPFQVVNDQIGQIAASSEEATASLEEVAAGAKEVTINSDHVSANTERCDESLIQVLRAMEDFTITVGQVSGKADSVSKISYATNQLCEEGTNVAKKAEQGMEGITRSTTEVSDIVTDIRGQMQEIGKIVNLISDISNQTNLLALNAAIEAARAGDAGRGFAVVAAEVKSLAQESRKSAENIANMISGLQQKSQAAADAMQNADSEVKMGNVAMKETLAVFAKIVDSVGDISKNMEEVASASEEQAASVQEITASINEVSSLVKETAGEAQKSSKTTRDATVAIDQISHVVGDLSGVVETLSSEIGRFEI